MTYIISGTVVVRSDGFTINAVSYFGSQINAAFSGSMAIEGAGIMPAHASKFNRNVKN